MWEQVLKRVRGDFGLLKEAVDFVAKDLGRFTAKDIIPAVSKKYLELLYKKGLEMNLGSAKSHAKRYVNQSSVSRALNTSLKYEKVTFTDEYGLTKVGYALIKDIRKEDKSKWVDNLSESKKKLLNKTPSFNVKFSKMTYPDNQKELPKVIQIAKKSKLTDKQKIDYDKNHIKLMLDIVGEKKSDWKKFIEDVDIHTLKLKMEYARPRPYEITDKLKGETDTSKSPSFPSGHAVEGYVFAKILGNKYPKKQKELDNMAEKIAMSRVQMELHFPSDIEAGKKVANLIAHAYLKVNKSEDWRKDARGDMEVSELVIMIQQALFYYEELLKKLEEEPVDLESIKEMVRDVIRILKEELE